MVSATSNKAPADGHLLRKTADCNAAKCSATAFHISLGRVVVDEPSNEIAAIPKLLEILELKGGLATLDAMGCQTEIADKIVESGADDLLAVKGNQPTLHDGLQAFFLDHLEDDFARVKVSRHASGERGHGREVILLK